MTIDQFDTIVLGAGAMGSAAAYHLARDGQRVLLLEQFEIAHTRGSSHGESRIFRYAYPNAAYARLAIQTKPLWRALEADAGEQLLRDTGGLDLGEGRAGQVKVSAVAAALESIGGSWERLDCAALARRFPQWRVSEETIAVYSPDAGVLSATRCVQVMATRAAAHGATIHDRETARQILPDAGSVEIVTDKDRYRARRLVVTAGPWSRQLLRDVGLELPLRVSQEQTVYFRPRANPDAFVPGRFTIWIHHREPNVYGFPIVGAPGVKLGFHRDERYIDIADYTREPRPEVVARLQAYLEQYLPDVAGEAFDPTTCLYTNTPDDDFIVATVPDLPHIAIGVGFSGHGFKFAIGIGRALADLVEHGETEMEIDHLGVDRFRGVETA
ncbi:MAG: N-methyl-L-tryptophan oxidase [Ardenticatenaceae bacterium]|nr:N-methyl-L-tryptophan oxidase [Ardenticatenaceae bacterium]